MGRYVRIYVLQSTMHSYSQYLEMISNEIKISNICSYSRFLERLNIKGVYIFELGSVVSATHHKLYGTKFWLIFGG